MYLPKHQYTFKSLDELDKIEALIDNAGNIVNVPGKNLIVTSFGEIYDRKTVNISKGDFSNAEQLFPIQSTEQTESPNQSGYEFQTSDSPERASFDSIISSKTPPTSDQMEAGSIKRCFYKNLSTGKVKEITNSQATELVNSKQRFEQVVCIDWEIKGPAKDQTVNGYFLEGIETRNQRRLDELKQAMPGTEALISNALEYVEDTLISQSQPIKQQNKDIVIPSPGKRL